MRDYNRTVRSEATYAVHYSDVMKLTESNYAEERSEKLPTLLQYLKNTPVKKRPKQFHINLIWFPNRFPSFGIETDSFRVSIASKSLMGVAIAAEKDEICDSLRSLHLSVSESESGDRIYAFHVGSTEGYWDVIGSDTPLGVRFVAN